MAQPLQMPLRDTPNTPKVDGKKPSELPRYLEDIDFLSDVAALDQAKKIKAAIRYAALDEVEVWQMLPEASATPANWDNFIKAVKKMYPGCEGTDRYSRADVQYLIQDYGRKEMHSQDNLGEYTRAFLKISTGLIANKKLAKMERDMLYLNGFPSTLQQKIRQCLFIVKQDLYPDDPYPMDDVTTVAKFLLTGSAFRLSLPPAYNPPRQSVPYQPNHPSGQSTVPIPSYNSPPVIKVESNQAVQSASLCKFCTGPGHYSGSNKCPNVCMFSTKVDTPQHLLIRAPMCECIK
jgi:hypothetical protein